jgi:hypothetical protein
VKIQFDENQQFHPNTGEVRSVDGLPGLLHPDPGNQARVPVILDRMHCIAARAT